MHQRIQRALAAQRRGQGGFTMVELAIVLVIAGIILVAALKGTDMINKAKIERVVSDIKGLQGMAFEHEKRTGKLPADCNADGVMSLDIEATAETKVVQFKGSDTSSGYTLDTDPAADAAKFCKTNTTSETNVNIAWNDLRKANILDPGRSNRILAKNQTNNWYAFGSIKDAGSNSANVIAVYDIPLWMAKGIDVALDGPDPKITAGAAKDGGQSGRVRLLNDGSTSSSNGAGLPWPDASHHDDIPVSITYQFDRALPTPTAAAGTP